MFDAPQILEILVFSLLKMKKYVTEYSLSIGFMTRRKMIANNADKYTSQTVFIKNDIPCRDFKLPTRDLVI